MKKIIIMLAAFAFITGCDDGEMTFKALDFATFGSPTRCVPESNTLYKTNGTEALVFNLPPILFPNVANGTARIIPVGTGTSYSMSYRNYSGAVGAGALCNSTGTPTILEEWPGSGNLSITSTERRDPTTNKLEGYNHALMLVTATFSNNGQEVTVVDNFLGTLETNLDIDFEFDEQEAGVANDPVRCTTDSSKLYKISVDNPAEVLQLNIDSGYFVTQERQSYDLDTDNDNGDIILYFIKYETGVGRNVICSPSPNDPLREQLWQATSGKIEITWEADTDNIFKHIIRFRDLVLRNNGANNEVYTPLNNETETYRFGPNPAN